MAQAERKNTTCPTGTVSPSCRTSADIAAKSKAEMILKPMALRRLGDGSCMENLSIAPAAGLVASLLRAGAPLLLLRRPWRPRDRRQGFDEGRHRQPVGVGELRGVPDHGGHAAAGRIE